MLAPEGVELNSFLTRVPADAAFVGDIHVSNPVYPRAGDVGRAALQRLETARDTAEPLYLRPSQAERLKRPGGEA